MLIRGIKPSHDNGLSSLVLTPCRKGKLVVVVVSNWTADRWTQLLSVTILTLSMFDLFAVCSSAFALNVGRNEPFILGWVHTCNVTAYRNTVS